MPSMLSSSSKPKSNDYTQYANVSIRLPEPEDSRAYRRADRLIRGVVPDGEVWVVERLLAGDTLGRIEVEELGKKIDGEGVRAREECCERNTRFDGQRTNVVLSLLTLVSIYTLQIEVVATNTRRPNAAQCVFRRRAKVMEDLVQLIDVAEP